MRRFILSAIAIAAVGLITGLGVASVDAALASAADILLPWIAQ